MTYKEIIKIIKNISLALPDVESFYTGDVYEINKDQSVKYGSVVLTNQEHSFDNVNDQFQYNFVLFYIDRLTDDENNRIDVQTAGINALTTIVKTIEDYGCIIDNVRYNVFKERFNDWCSGVYGTFSIQVDDNDCVEEFEIITPDKLRAITINSNGTYKGLFNEVNVNVSDKEFINETKSIDINENGTYSVEKSDNVDGMSSVEINVNVPIPEPNLQTKSISITENGTQTISADNGYDGLQSVSITTNVSGGTTSDKIKMIDGMKLNNNRYVIDYARFDTSELTDFRYMLANTDFQLLPSEESIIDLSTWDTSSAINMCNLFYDCDGVESIIGLENWNTSNVKLMEGTFNSCTRITTLDLSSWNVSNVTAFSFMFSRAIYLKSLNLSGWDMSKATRYNSNVFNGCTSLTDLNMTNAILPKSNLTDFGLDSCPLTVESLVSVLNALPQLSSSESFTCTIGSTNLAKLTDAQKAIATNKGWILN